MQTDPKAPGLPTLRLLSITIATAPNPTQSAWRVEFELFAGHPPYAVFVRGVADADIVTEARTILKAQVIAVAAALSA